MSGPILPAILVACLAPVPQSVVEEAKAILDREAAELRRIAEELRPKDPARADSILALIAPPRPRDGSIRFVPLPVVDLPAGRTDVPNEAKAARDSAAEALLKLAEKAAAEGRFAAADEAIRGVIARSPDQERARHLLGYVRHETGWARPFAVDMLRQGKVDHPTFGWIPSDWVPHLEDGKLPGVVANGVPERWLPVDRADLLRKEITKGWVITTEHFTIRTSAPLSKAIVFGRRLEDFHELFTSLMADVLGESGLVARRFRGNAASRERHEVWYFGTKGEYVRKLRPRYGRDVDRELGRYDPDANPGETRGRSYFYRDDKQAMTAESTLYHEASHQLLFESGAPSEYTANVGQYWLFEGLGTYFETVTPQTDGSLAVGGLVGPRLELARSQLVDADEAVPVAKLIGFDRARFDGAGGGNVYTNYAEAMALAVFLMNGRDGRYRAAFIDYAGEAYRGKFARNGTGRPLTDRLAIGAPELQEQLLEFLKAWQPKSPTSETR